MQCFRFEPLIVECTYYINEIFFNFVLFFSIEISVSTDWKEIFQISKVLHTWRQCKHSNLFWIIYIECPSWIYLVLDMHVTTSKTKLPEKNKEIKNPLLHPRNLSLIVFLSSFLRGAHDKWLLARTCFLYLLCRCLTSNLLNGTIPRWINDKSIK